MSRFILVVLVTLSLSSCASLKMAAQAIGLTDTASNGIDAEVTLGKKQEEINTSIGETTNNNSAEKITNNVDNIPPLVLFMLVLGWLLPSPSEIGKGFFKLFRRNP